MNFPWKGSRKNRIYRKIKKSKLGKTNFLLITERDWPLLYAERLQRPDESLRFFNDQVVMGSISMTSVVIWG